MKKIFLSASIPVEGRQFYGTTNDIAIASAVMAFARICAQRKVPFYFGGHPAISPLVWRVVREYSTKVNELITIYQSDFFREKVPAEVSFYRSIRWTPQKQTKEESIRVMRETMFKENETSVAVFIGGMDGVIEECNMISDMCPNVRLFPLKSVGGASSKLYDDLELKDESCNFAFTHMFEQLISQVYN